jgi:hypothetical protein
MQSDDFARTTSSGENTEEGFVVGHLEYHLPSTNFERACYVNNFVQSFDWGAWAREVRRYMRDPTLVRSARLTTCIKLITAHLRAERFCEGHLQGVLKSGHMIAILRRLSQLEEK